jgi:hypothetical protein
MNRAKKRALKVLKQWIDQENNDYLKMSLSDFVLDSVLNDDTKPLTVYSYGKHGDILHYVDSFTGSGIYDTDGINLRFKSLLAKNNLRAECDNDKHFTIYDLYE